MRHVAVEELAENDSRFHRREGAELQTDSEYLEISETDFLYLRIHGHGDDQRFAELLKDVWEQIPASYRCEMTKWWSKEGNPNFTDLANSANPVPHIELRNDWPDDCGSGDGEPAIFRKGGLHLLFQPHILDEMPCEMVKLIIAHELAHAWQVAKVPTTLYPKANGLIDPSCIENWPNDFPGKVEHQLDLAERSAHTISINRWEFEAECPIRWISINSLGNGDCNRCSKETPCPIEYLCKASGR